MPISKSHPRRPLQRVTHLDASLSPRSVDSRPGWTVGGHRPPPQAVLDKIAEETLHKGYQGKRHPLCSKCFTRKSATGACNCPSNVDMSRVKKLTTPHALSPLAKAVADALGG